MGVSAPTTRFHPVAAETVALRCESEKALCHPPATVAGHRPRVCGSLANSEDEGREKDNKKRMRIVAPRQGVRWILNDAVIERYLIRETTRLDKIHIRHSL